MTSTTLHRSGTGPPLLLVHGVGLDHTMWNLVTPTLALDREVIAYDLLGHGRSPDPEGPRTIKHFVDQLGEIVDSLGSRTIDAVGSSLGALIVLHAALEQPARFDHIVLANIVFGRTNSQREAVQSRLRLVEEAGMDQIADLAVGRWFTPQWQLDHPEATDQVRRRLQSTNLQGYLKAYRLFAGSELASHVDMHQLTTPTLVATGELDLASTPAMSTALAARLTHGKAEILPGLHHLPPIEAPRPFAAMIIDFLATENPLV